MLISNQSDPVRSQYSFELASEKDDLELRSLLREIPVGDRLQFSFERDPSYFQAARLSGAFVQTLIARNRSTNKIVGFGSRSIREAFVNGEKAALGYLGDLRLHPQNRNGPLVARGYRFFRELHQDKKVSIYFTVIFSDNQRALSVLTKKRADLPSYTDWGKLLCPGLLLKQPKLKTLAIPDCKIISGTPEFLPQIVDCLNRFQQRRQFGWIHQVKDFEDTSRWPYFSASNFFVAIRNDRVVGVLGVWNQSLIKQTRLIEYAGNYRWQVPISNFFGRWMKRPHYPKPGQIIPYLTACFLGVDQDDPLIFTELLTAACRHFSNGKFLYLIIGLHERDPLAKVLSQFRSIPVEARLFVVTDSDRVDLDTRIPMIEPGML
jgi:hypothetical protein